MKRRAKRCIYKPVSFETMRRIIQNGRFPDAMRQAYGGDLEPLHEYLRTHLPADHVDEIAAFHQRRLRRDFKHALKPAQEAARRIVAIAKGVKRYGRKVPPGDYQRAIDRVTEMLDVDGELSGVDRLQLAKLNKSMLNALRRARPSDGDLGHAITVALSVRGIASNGFRRPTNNKGNFTCPELTAASMMKPMTTPSCARASI